MTKRQNESGDLIGILEEVIVRWPKPGGGDVEKYRESSVDYLSECFDDIDLYNRIEQIEIINEVKTTPNRIEIIVATLMGAISAQYSSCLIPRTGG